MDLEQIKSEIKYNSGYLIDILNDYGANIKESSTGNGVGKGKCIIHGGDGDNLHVIVKNNEYYAKCHTRCKFYGDIFEVLKEKEDLEFLQAIKYINDRFNLNYNLNNIKLDKLDKLKHDLSFKKVYKDKNTVDEDYEFQTSYIYKNEDGTPLYTKVRFKLKAGVSSEGKNKKTFRNYRLTDDGEKYIAKSGLDWREGDELKKVQRVLYNLPGIIKAVNEKKYVFIVEGEKDADNLNTLGFTATTTVSAKAWIDEYNKYFKGAKVIIIGDNDETGQEHVETLKKNLIHIVSSLRVVDIPMLEEKADISDYIEKLKQKNRDKKKIKEKIYDLINHSLDLKDDHELQQDGKGIYFTKVKTTDEEIIKTKVYITNFKIDHANIYRSVDTTSQKIELKLVSSLGKTTIIESDARTLFTDVRTFRKVLGIDYVYNSNNQMLPRLQSWILSYFIKSDISNYTITGIRAVDSKNVLVTNKGILYADGTFDTTITADNTLHNIDFTDLKQLNAQEAEELAKYLFSFNTKQIVYSTLGLAVAHLTNYFVRESNLDNLPVLQNVGESNSGKTKTFGIIRNLLNISSKPLSYSNITEFTILRAFNSTYLPLLIDEVKPSKSSQHKLNMISGHIRNCTEGYEAEKGRKDLTTTKFTYLASLMLSGEELITENAVVNRSNISWYSRSNFTSEGAQAIDYLVRDDRGIELLRRFSITLYTQILSRYSVDYIKRVYSNIKPFFIDLKDDRIRNTAIYTFLGILELEQAFKSLGVDVSSYLNIEEAKNLIIKNLSENVMDSDEDGQLAEYEEILIAIDKLAGSTDLAIVLNHNEHYKREYSNVYLDLVDIWDRLNIYYSKYNHSGRMMERKEFQKHLRKSKYIDGSSTSEYYVGKYLTKTRYTKEKGFSDYSKLRKTYKLKLVELYHLGLHNIVPETVAKQYISEPKVVQFAEEKEQWTGWKDIYGESEYEEITNTVD